ncbi:Uncharacterised protein [Streptococcus pneumoniae]|nr:Uncharacterised protein [Streptococcus pneumoniae]
MPIEEAEKIAQSQVAWAILFILLFFIIIRYLIKTSDKREKKIMDLHEQSKADSNRREERLMHNHSHGRRHSKRNGSHERPHGRNRKRRITNATNY